MKIFGSILIGLTFLSVSVFFPIMLLPTFLGIIPAAIANNKGRSFNGWWIYGILLFIIALAHSIFIKRDIKSLENKLLSEGMKKCPYCAELVKGEAIICKHCGKDL